MTRLHYTTIRILLTQCLTFYKISKGLVNEERFFKGAIRVRSNSFFSGDVLESSRGINAFHCTHKCLQNKRCISITFCAKHTGGRCYLYKDGISGADVVSSLVERKGCIFYQFADPFEECRRINCQNGGKCHHDNYLGRFTCSCKGDFSGEFCQNPKPIVYKFTNLQKTGRYGPTSTSAYQGTTLDGKVTLSNGKQEWTVPKNGRYHIVVEGASGGPGFMGKMGGLGARVHGYATLHASDVIVIVVGQEGLSKQAGGGGGGGGSFVFYKNDQIIAIAGGGGGGGGQLTQMDGQGALASNTGGIRGGSRGFGGTVCMDGHGSQGSPGGGGGYAKDGRCYKGPTCSDNQTCTEGGGSHSSNFVGGIGDWDGGFGGGGAAVGYYPGGGGGFSGGGVEAKSQQGQAGGGGSKTFTPSWQAEAGVNKGHGSVVITLVG